MTMVQRQGLELLLGVLPLLAVCAVWRLLSGRMRLGRTGVGAIAWCLTALLVVVGVIGLLPTGILVLPLGALLVVACARGHGIVQRERVQAPHVQRTRASRAR